MCKVSLSPEKFFCKPSLVTFHKNVSKVHLKHCQCWFYLQVNIPIWSFQQFWKFSVQKINFENLSRMSAEKVVGDTVFSGFNLLLRLFSFLSSKGGINFSYKKNFLYPPLPQNEIELKRYFSADFTLFFTWLKLLSTMFE